MSSRQIQNAVHAVLPGIIAQAAPLRVLLFGSAIRGGNKPVRDLDFLVVVPDREHPAAVADRLYLGVRRKPMPCDFSRRYAFHALPDTVTDAIPYSLPP
jgi:hypothetical protein